MLLLGCIKKIFVPLQPEYVYANPYRRMCVGILTDGTTRKKKGEA